MASLVLLVAPWLEMAGRVAAIVICLFVFILVLLALAINLALSFGAAWVREKAELLKSLRPSVDSLNTTTELVQAGNEPPSDANATFRRLATLPGKVTTIDQKVEQTSDRVMNTAIELSARATQAKTIVKAFFLPGLMKKRSEPSAVKDEPPVQESAQVEQAQVPEAPVPQQPARPSRERQRRRASVVEQQQDVRV